MNVIRSAATQLRLRKRVAANGEVTVLLRGSEVSPMQEEGGVEASPIGCMSMALDVHLRG
jgi:hypothetical protein